MAESRPGSVATSEGCLAECLSRVTAAEQLLAATRTALHELCERGDPLEGCPPSCPPKRPPAGKPNGCTEPVPQPAGLPHHLGSPRQRPNVVHRTATSQELLGATLQMKTDWEEAMGMGVMDQVQLDLMGVEEKSDEIHAAMSGQHKLGFLSKMGMKRPKASTSVSLADREAAKEAERYWPATSRASLDLAARRGVWWPCCCGIRVPILHPESQRKIVWTLVGLVFIIMECYSIPYFLSFGSPEQGGGMYYVSSVISTYFLCDIVASFITAYTDEDGLVIRPTMLAKKYMKGWFTLDVLASIPWDWIPQPEENGGGAARSSRALRFIRVLRILRLARLLRLAKMKGVMESIETYIEANPLFVFYSHLIRLMFLLSTLIHWAGCGWYAVGSREDVTPNWVMTKIPDAPKEQAYVWSVYFATVTMTTVGYGDIGPTNFDEVSFCLFLLAIACVVFAALMGTLTDMITSLNQSKHVMSEKKTQLMRYMNWRMVPRHLALTIRQHLLFIWDTYQGYDTYEETLKDELPPVLRANLAFHVYGKVLMSLPFFSWMKDFSACLKDLSSNVYSMTLEAGDDIFTAGQVNETIYVLLSGRVFLTPNRILKSKPDDLALMDADIAMPRTKREVDESEHIMSGTNRRDGVGGMKSGVMTESSNALRAKDIMERSSARIIQRRWRKWKANASVQLKRKMTMDESALGKNSSMVSKMCTAPAYFGESCLWIPQAQWTTGPQVVYAYTGRCETRGEFVRIPRKSVQDVIESYSHVMTERFEYFRQAVMANTLERLPQRPESKMGRTKTSERSVAALTEQSQSLGSNPRGRPSAVQPPLSGPAYPPGPAPDASVNCVPKLDNSSNTLGAATGTTRKGDSPRDSPPGLQGLGRLSTAEFAGQTWQQPGVPIDESLAMSFLSRPAAVGGPAGGDGSGSPQSPGVLK